FVSNLTDASHSTSLPLLPCAPRPRQGVVEGTHHITAKGTGVEPYTPWPLSRPGWGPRWAVPLLRDATPSSHPGPARILRRARHTGSGLSTVAFPPDVPGDPSKAGPRGGQFRGVVTKRGRTTPTDGRPTR